MAVTTRWPKFLSLVLVLFLTGAPRAGWAAVKLFMKDGTYQLVKSYEVRGDRVRYYSVERSAWEEVPLTLVDFPATERAQQEEKASSKKQVEEARELDRLKFEQPAETGQEVAPGVRLPREEGVFAIDGERVVRMIQSSTELLTDKKRAVLARVLPGPFIKNRVFVVLPGAKAAVRILTTQPVFYAQLADGSGARLELVAVKPAKEVRVVDKADPSAPGTTSELVAAVPLEREELQPGLFKLTPTQPLALGEYALGELVQQKLSLNLWDFGVDGTPMK